MAVLSSGPIENNAISGTRPTQQITVIMDNRDTVNSATLLIQGYILTGTRSLYVLESLVVLPNQVITNNYFANFDRFEFVFTTGGTAADQTGISVWGKNESGQLVTAHRLVLSEL
jgi:hypothetical protein